MLVMERQMLREKNDGVIGSVADTRESCSCGLLLSNALGAMVVRAIFVTWGWS